MSSNPHNGFPSGYFKIRSRLNGKCLTPENNNILKGATLVMAAPDSTSDQLWYVNKLGCLINKQSGYTIDVKDSNKSNGTRLQLWTMNGDSNQIMSVDNTGRITTKLHGKNISYDENNHGNAPVYIWENYNGPSQKWYFERKPHNETIQLLHSYNGSHGSKKINGNKIVSSAEYTYQTWMKLKRFEPGKNKGILVRSKDEDSTEQRMPGITILKNKPTFFLSLTTIKQWDDACEKNNTEVELNKWINIAMVVKHNILMFYIDGKQVTRCKIAQNIPASTDIPLWIGYDNSHLKLHNLEYSNHALKHSAIKTHMKRNSPHKSNKSNKSSSIDAGVTIARLISNGSHPKCPARKGRLNDYAWCAAKANDKYYLQLDLDRKYHVSHLLTQGRKDTDQWVKQYKVSYKEDKHTGHKWIKLPKIFTSNHDRDTIKRNSIDITTEAIRIHPIKWNKYPSIRVGLSGRAASSVLIKDFTSNGTLTDCGPNQARLSVKGNWCSVDKNSKYYLQANLADNYKISKILLKGRTENDQWVKTYKIKYKNIDGDWVNYKDTLHGNKDSISIVSTDVNFSTKAIRIYPATWNNWPSLSIGFDGSKHTDNKCAQYKHLSIHGKDEQERNLNMDEYNKDCRKISYFDHINIVNKHKLDYENAYNIVAKTKKAKESKSEELKMLKDKIKVLDKSLKKASMEIEIEKHKKCPPTSKCLPIINPITTTASKQCDINSFDIKTHGNFHKYVLSSNIKACPSPPVTAHSSNINLTKKAKECLANFENNNIDHISNMSGGSISSTSDFGVILELRNADTVERAFKDDPYSITKHKDFNKLMKDYMLKSKCDTQQVNESIKLHPQYKALMDKYALRDNSTCPPVYKPVNGDAIKKLNELSKKYKALSADIKEHSQFVPLMKKYSKGKDPETNKYIPCSTDLLSSSDKEQTRKILGDITKHPGINDYVKIKDVNSMCQKIVNKAANTVNTDISKHPQYRALMSKYAIKDGTTCPPTYKPCIPRKPISEIPITSHPDIVNYVSKSTVKKIVHDARKIKTQIEKANEVIQNQLYQIKLLQNTPIKPIHEHPSYNNLIDTHRRTPITQHPDMHKYMLKSQLPALIDRECRKNFK